MATSDPYARRVWRGKQFDNRTVSALTWAEKKYLRRAPLMRKHWLISQGSYNAGGVNASKGTHDGGGAVDISTSNMTDRQKRGAVKWLRRAGFAAWLRPYLPGPNGWGEHIHAILLEHRTASDGAKDQMVSYKGNRNGLANNAYDGTWRPRPLVRWSHRRGRPVRL